MRGDNEGNFTFVNARAGDLFAYDPTELLGQPVEVLIPERFREAHNRHGEAYAADPQIRPMGAIVLLTDGITEARTHDRVLFQKEGVIAHLAKVTGASPDQVAEALLQAATLHAEGNLQDDVAIVVLGCERNTLT